MAKRKNVAEEISDSSVQSDIPVPRRKKQVDTAPESANIVASTAPAGTKEHTMSDTITIQGLEFAVPTPYAEGHVLTAGEASALNQVLHENLRNNFAVRIKKIKADGQEPVLEALQADLDAYAESYSFGVRTAGGTRTPADPVKREAINLAKAAVKAALAAKGVSLKDAGGNEWLAEKAAELVATRPIFTEQAKARIEEQKALASDILAA